MIQSIKNSSTNLDITQASSSQSSGARVKSAQTSGLSRLSNSTQDIIIKETLNLIKGVVIDLLGAALTALSKQTSPTTNNETANGTKGPACQTPETTTPKSPSTENPTTGATTTEGATTKEPSPPRKNEGLSSFLERELKPNGEKQLHEEQLQYGIAGYLLNEKSPKLYEQYKTAYSEYQSKTGSKSSFEDGVKAALKDLVATKQITKAEAEAINGKSFRAAQLDNDLKTLFDDKGGPNDKTIAVLGSKEAAEKVDRTFGRIRRGELTAAPRSLDEPSNSKSSSVSGKSNGSGNAGFLWKPVSESDGKLVILAPANISQNVESVSIYKVGSNGKKTLIESGRSAGIANENRAHFRFKQAGGKYPDGSIVEIKLRGGEVISETIKESSARVQK